MYVKNSKEVGVAGQRMSDIGADGVVLLGPWEDFALLILSEGEGARGLGVEE